MGFNCNIWIYRSPTQQPPAFQQHGIIVYKQTHRSVWVARMWVCRVSGVLQETKHPSQWQGWTRRLLGISLSSVTVVTWVIIVTFLRELTRSLRGEWVKFYRSPHFLQIQQLVPGLLGLQGGRAIFTLSFNFKIQINIQWNYT